MFFTTSTSPRTSDTVCHLDKNTPGVFVWHGVATLLLWSTLCPQHYLLLRSTTTVVYSLPSTLLLLRSTLCLQYYYCGLLYASDNYYYCRLLYAFNTIATVVYSMPSTLLFLWSTLCLQHYYCRLLYAFNTITAVIYSSLCL